MIRAIILTAAFGALLACAKREDAPTASAEPAASEAAPIDAAAEPIEGDAASAWVELTGAWARDGECGDYAKEWRIEAEAFHLGETHCKIERLELLQNGARAIAHCSVEGDDDRVEDAFKFVRCPDFSLSIVNETNEAATDGLQRCSDRSVP